MELSAAEVAQIAEEAAQEFLGRWNRLVSTTNWEKGRIICEWRTRLLEAGADPATATDEAWSRCVGNVSPQHVGRLRRVYQRFSATVEQYAGLYWSHFQAALDWDDAEMYLEGARVNAWSVAQMRAQRVEAMGGAPADAAASADEAAEEFDDDAPAAEHAADAPLVSSTTGEVRNLADDPPAGNFETGGPLVEGEPWGTDEHEAPFETADEPAVAAVRPFADLAQLPPDLADAFERFKLALLHHKLAGWQEVSCDDALGALEALKQLALAP